jgi:chromosome segregation ATPase
MRFFLTEGDDDALISELQDDLDHKKLTISELEAAASFQCDAVAQIKQQAELVRRKSDFQIAELQRELHEKQSEVAELKDENDELADKVSRVPDLENANRILSTTNSQLRQQLNATTATHGSKIPALEHEVEQKDAELAALEAEKWQLAEQAQRVPEIENEMKDLANKLARQREQSDATIQKLKLKIGDLERLLDEKDLEISCQVCEKDELGRRAARLSELEQLNRTLHETTMQLRQDNDAAARRFELTIRQLKQSLAGANSKLDAQQKENIRLTTDLEKAALDAKAEIADLKRKNQEQLVENASLSRTVDRLQALLSDRGRELAEANEQRSAGDAELRLRISEVKSQVERSRSMNEKLQGQLRDERRQHAESEAALRGAMRIRDDEVRALTASLAQARGKLAKLQAKEERAARTAQQFRAEIAKGAAETEGLREANKEQRAEIARQKKEIPAAMARLKRTEAEGQRAKKALAQIRRFVGATSNDDIIATMRASNIPGLSEGYVQCLRVQIFSTYAIALLALFLWLHGPN